MRTLFFGTSAFAVPSFEAVAKHSQLLGAVTQPDRPAGRGQKLMASPVKTAAQTAGITVFEPQKLSDIREHIAQLGEIDLFAVASYGKILPQWLLDIPKLGALNVHPSLLPQYRGATPIQSALRNGETKTGVTIMLMDSGMDTGDIVLQESLTIEPDENYGRLHDRLAELGAELLARALQMAGGGSIPHTPQTGEASVTKPIRKEDLQIDWSWPTDRIVNFVRSYSPDPGARAILFDVPLKILSATAESRDGALEVPSGNGTVWIGQVIAPNKPLQTGAQFGRTISERK